MSTRILNRYETDANGHCIIDVAADGIEELYSHFERDAPYMRRDLDPELTDYLIDSAYDLERNRYVVRLTLKRALSQESLDRITKSMKLYFTYRAEREQRETSRMIRKSILLLSLGLIILFIAVWINQWLGAERSVIANVFAQGLTVAAWVSLWEALSTFLIEWFPQRRRIKLYYCLADVPLDVRIQN